MLEKRLDGNSAQCHNTVSESCQIAATSRKGNTGGAGRGKLKREIEAGRKKGGLGGGGWDRKTLMPDKAENHLHGRLDS